MLRFRDRMKSVELRWSEDHLHVCYAVSCSRDHCDRLDGAGLGCIQWLRNVHIKAGGQAREEENPKA